MNKIIRRLLTFFIGIPLVLLIVFVDYMNNLPLHITIGFFSVLAANEFYDMLKINHSLFPKPLLLVFTVLLPYFTFLFFLYVFIFSMLILLAFIFN